VLAPNVLIRTSYSPAFQEPVLFTVLLFKKCNAAAYCEFKLYKKQFGPLKRGRLCSLNRISYYKQTNSVALVRKRTIPTERPPLVGEVSANFSG
jgi:hypothetical protein